MLKSITFTNGEIEKQNYEYKATVIRVVDGDTIELSTDIGFNVGQGERFRLHGVYALETIKRWKQTEDEKKLGIRAKEILEELLPVGKQVAVRTFKDKAGMYGRYIAVIYTPELGEKKSLNEHLLEKYGSPMFLTLEQHQEMIEKREEKLGVKIEK